ncbi:hypothetical protein [Streptomyces flavofungini]|nr:hypothetical protein [Streptomyces flavofungini]
MATKPRWPAMRANLNLGHTQPLLPERVLRPEGRMGVGAEAVVALCAVVIAVASLVVSVYEARVARQHNRQSVRPLLQLHRTWQQGRRAGILLTNVGLGPAVIVRTTVTVDGELIGSWDKATADNVRDRLPARPSAVTFSADEVIAISYEQFLLSVASYDPQADAGFEELANRRLTLEIRYESLYGGENFQVVLHTHR